MNPEGTALVTGASRGIGRATALELARRGFDVVATMRDPAAGAALSAEGASLDGGTLTVAALDVLKPETIEIPSNLRVLVNNAGVETEYLSVEDSDLDGWRRVFETNVFGLVEVTRRALPALRENGGGVICNVTTSSLLFPMPFYSVYRASKAAVAALGESLRSEVAGHGIRVLEIMPGPIDTEMLAASDRLPESAKNEAYRALAERVHEQRKGVGAMITPAANAAQAIAEAILDDASPLRVGCDPLSVGALAARGETPEEEFLKAFVDAYRDV